MKNKFLKFLALIVITFLGSLASLHAQNDCVYRGNFAIGSGLGYSNSVANIEIDNGGVVQRGGITAYQIHITPTIGYFLANSIVLGLGMDYLVNSSRNTNTAPSGAQNIADTKLLFGPYARLYLPFTDDQAFFLGAVYGYGKSKTQIIIDGDSQTAHVVLSTLGVGPGYSIFSDRRVALEAQVKYNYGISQSDFLVAGVSQSARTRVTSWDFVVGIHFYFTGQNSSRATSIN